MWETYLSKSKLVNSLDKKHNNILDYVNNKLKRVNTMLLRHVNASRTHSSTKLREKSFSYKITRTKAQTLNTQNTWMKRKRERKKLWLGFGSPHKTNHPFFFLLIPTHKMSACMRKDKWINHALFMCFRASILRLFLY